MGEAKSCSGRKRQGPMAKIYCYNDFLLIFLGGEREREDEDKKMIKIYFYFYFFKTNLFGA